MAIAIDPRVVTIVSATALEAREARKALPEFRVVEAGIGLTAASVFEGVAISCGVAGGLRADLPTGTVVVPRSVRRPDGTLLACDPELTDLLSQAARGLGYEPVNLPIYTSVSLVHGNGRAGLASEYAAVDMETGLINAERVACVRVILDTPLREISPAWLHPERAIFQPRAWFDLPFLAREGPKCARLAAQVIAAAISG
jgi:adenosylhomocysteine nucleosidase